MAQLVARLVRNEKVRGSNPLSSTLVQKKMRLTWNSRSRAIRQRPSFEGLTAARPGPGACPSPRPLAPLVPGVVPEPIDVTSAQTCTGKSARLRSDQDNPLGRALTG
jgi:hypothetical protein